MIKYFYKNLRSKQLEELAQYKPGTWVYVEAPKETELDDLVQRFSLTKGHLEDALDEDEMPRLEKEGDQSYIFVRFTHRESDGSFVTVPLLIVTGKDLLITVSLARLPSLDSFMSGKISFATTQRAKLILLILQQITEQYDLLIGQTSKKIKAIRSRLRGHEITDQDFLDFVMIDDELNEFLSSLQPTNATLRRLLLGRYMPLFAEDQDIVEDLLLGNEQSIEACSSNIKSIVGIREAHSSISSNSLNRTMKLLTTATLGIAIPNVFFGLYSMNVALPLKSESYMFWIIIGFTVVVTATVFIIGRRKRIF
ncbi:MAG TPA: magnesium transporter CorA family protein [Patescibacteria group bacterium]|nr:magnesium transporter CorA family protein [Patescibacteria group bacterium]